MMHVTKTKCDSTGHSLITLRRGYMEWNSAICEWHYNMAILLYNRLSLSQSQRDSLKYFEKSVPQHIRFAELRKK